MKIESGSFRPIFGVSCQRFRDSSAQNHFGPGLLGPDVSAHFSIWDCSAHFSGTARPIFFLFFFGGGGGRNLLFYSVYVHQNKIQETLFNMIIIPAAIYLLLLSRSISDHHLRCGGWLNLEFSKREKHSGWAIKTIYKK